MSSMQHILSPNLYFSYNQFFVFDKEVGSPACDWTDAHSRQGFARRDGTIAMGTLLEFGDATVRVVFGPPQSLKSYERVIAVPLEIKSGRLAVEGVEEYPIDRSISVEPSIYRVVIAQRVIDDEVETAREEIDLFLEPHPEGLHHSEILVADDALDPPETLVETADEPQI